MKAKPSTLLKFYISKIADEFLSVIKRRIIYIIISSIPALFLVNWRSWVFLTKDTGNNGPDLAMMIHNLLEGGFE